MQTSPQIQTVSDVAPSEANIKGKLLDFAWQLKKEGKKDITINRWSTILKTLVYRGANLNDPESVKTVLALQQWKDSTKNMVLIAYKAWLRVFKIPCDTIPKYRQQQTLPFLPLENEIDQLIAGTSKKVATFLQLLKEVYCRCGEAWSLEWINIDSEHNIITINNPEKNSLPRQVKVSSKLISMLNALPKRSQRVFGDGLLDHFRQNFMTQRKRVATTLQNQRINKITFHTLRHFGATMEYHKTKDILHVQQRLGHRSITSTMLYTHLVNFESDDYHVAVAKTLKEDEDLIKAGFEYITEREGMKVYRKRK